MARLDRLTLMAVAIGLGGCQSPLQKPADTLRVVSFEQLGQYWLHAEQGEAVADGENINFRIGPGALPKAEDGCVAVMYAIEPTGETTMRRTVRSVPPGAFEKTGEWMVRQMRFVPAPGNAARERVLTVQPIDFGKGPPSSGKDGSSPCGIVDIKVER